MTMVATFRFSDNLPLPSSAGSRGILLLALRTQPNNPVSGCQATLPDSLEANGHDSEEV